MATSRSFRLLGFAAAVCAASIGFACGAADAGTAQDQVSLVGVRVTWGDAVSCPQIRDDEGRLHSLSYLSPDVAIGARVAVTGRYAVVTKCLGEVLVVEDERRDR